MKRSINKILVFFFLNLFLNCQFSENNLEFSFHEVKKNVDQHISNSNKEEIDMAKLTPFNWETLYIFKPYTPISEINDSLGFVWEGADKTFINQEDSFNLLVFTKENSVVNYIKWPRNEGDFLKLENSKYFYDSAKFVLRSEKYGNQDWLFFYMK